MSRDAYRKGIELARLNLESAERCNDSCDSTLTRVYVKRAIRELEESLYLAGAHNILYADSARGIYIPQFFAESVRRELVQNVTDEDWNILESGPDHEHYWDAWNDVTSSAILTDDSGDSWTLYQDGDLWLVPSDWQPETE